MTETLLTYLYGVSILLFGIVLTAAFAGIQPSRKNLLYYMGLFAFSGGLQLAVTLMLSDALVWKLYPLITHLPLIVLLCTVFRKSLVTAAAATFTAYLFCQPSKWFSVLVDQIVHSTPVALSARILCLIPVGYVSLVFLAPYLSEIFSKDRRSVCIFGFVPAVYYLFDYVTAVYTNLWLSNIRVVMEFLPFFLATGLGQTPATIVYSYVGGMLTGGAKALMIGLLCLFSLVILAGIIKQIYTEYQAKKAAKAHE